MLFERRLLLLAMAAGLISLLSFTRAEEEAFSKLSLQKDWPWWRGPQRNGHADKSSAPPTSFKLSEAKWTANIPGRGHSSPIVVGDRIFLTTADTSSKVQYALAYNREDGKPLWTKKISQGGFPENNHPKNTEATPTIACDGERLFITFFHHRSIELTSLDLEGNPLWKKKAGLFNPRRYEYGYAPSPVLYEGEVIVAGEYDGESFIASFDRTNGEEKWRIDRPDNITFSTPSIGHIAGKDQLLISGGDRVTSYDPKTGASLWSVPGTTAATCGTMVWDEDIVFASGGYPRSETIAIKADGSGKVLWKNAQKCYEQSMLAYDGHLYALTGNGVAFCWRAEDGKEMWNQRLAGPVSASPVLANGNIYWANEYGTLYVFKASPEKFIPVAENQIGTDAFPCPAVAGNQIFLRVGKGNDKERQEILCCFGEP